MTSLVLALLLACQGMAMAGSVSVGKAYKNSAMPAMPGCHLMKAVAKPSSTGDSDCQHFVKALDNGGTAGLAWAHTPAVIPLWTSPVETFAGIPWSALPAHDPVVDPPPTLRLHRFLE